MINLSYRCLKCDRDLVQRVGEIFCPCCGSSWPMREGIITFTEDKYYWGEIPRSELVELINLSKRSYWRTVISERFEVNDPWRFTSIVDFNRANWISMLPITEKGVALDVGSGMGAVSQALSYNYEKVVCLEPVYERIKFSKIRMQQEGIKNIDFVRASITNMPFHDGTFDLILMNGILEWVGKWEQNIDPRDAQLQVLTKICGKLKKGGVLLIGIENRLGYSNFLGRTDHNGLKFTMLMPRKLADIYTRWKGKRNYRSYDKPEWYKGYRTYTYTWIGYADLLHKAGFSKVESFFPYPEYNNPHTILPLGCKKLLSNHLSERISRKTLWKWMLLWPGLKIIVHLSFFRYIAPDYLILARKDYKKEKNKTLCSNSRVPSFNTVENSLVHRVCQFILRNRFQLGLDLPKPNYLTWSVSATGSPLKTIVRIIDETNGNAVAVAKVINWAVASKSLDAEYENLECVRKIVVQKPTLQAAIPQPLALIDIGNNRVLIETTFNGQSLESVLWRHSPLLSSRRRLYYLQLLFKWLLTFHKQFFISAHKKGELLRPEFYQHGDFSTGNILLVSNRRIGLVDWEYFGQGYPPLFDLFCLVTSFARDSELVKTEKFQDIKLFKKIYFNENWLSEATKSFIKKYIQTFHLKQNSVYRAFLQYLNIRYKRALALHGSLNQITRSYKSWLEYACKNRVYFVLVDN